MKTLYITRHAKSSWDYEDLADHDRPLNKRGRKAAPKMGRFLKEQGHMPDLILTSPAVRALTTATLLAKELGYEQERIQVAEEIYGAGKMDLLRLVQQTPNSVSSLLLVGHNNALTDFGNYLSPKNVANIPTAGIMALTFETENWQTAGPERCSFLFFEFPKNLELSQ